MQSEVSGASLDNFYILILDYSKNGVLPPALKMRAAVKLSGLTMSDHFGYIGKSLLIIIFFFPYGCLHGQFNY